MPTQQQVLEALQRLQHFENKVYELVVAKYLSASITSEPLEKVRLICEAAMMAKELANKYASVLIITHKVALALLTPKPSDQFVAVPWPFPPSEESYRVYISPWLATFPYPQYGNEVVRRQQEARLAGKQPWEQFFIITQELNLSPVALWQLRHEFYTYAMPALMQMTADLSKILSPSSFLAVIGGAGGGMDNGKRGNYGKRE